jgi:hypothetical protein
MRILESKGKKPMDEAKRKKNDERVYRMAFSRVYPMYVQKAERKGRTRAEVDTIIAWLTGYGKKALAEIMKKGTDLETFFEEAPGWNPNAAQIHGTICGYKIDEIDDPTIRKVRYLDKLIDELAQGRAMEKILRA